MNRENGLVSKSKNRQKSFSTLLQAAESYNKYFIAIFHNPPSDLKTGAGLLLPP